MRVVYGQAGSGKTYVLIREAEELVKKGKKVVILCPTHSSKRNIINRCGIKGITITTYFAFYRIDYKNMMIVGYLEEPDNILFDEFSMINRELFKSIMRKTSPRVEITLYGDPAQLNPVGSSQNAKISMGMLKRCLDENMDFQMIYQYIGSIFSTKYFRNAKKYKLERNHRANEKISRVIREMFYGDEGVKIEYVGLGGVMSRMRNGEWTFIASTYKSLESIYEKLNDGNEGGVIVKCSSSVPHLRRIYFKSGDRYMVGENCEEFVNGEIVRSEVLGDGSVVLESEDSRSSVVYRGEISILPIRFLSAHKSQGMTIPKVVVDLDKLFEPSILYTMVTRASEDICFYREEAKNEEIERHLRETKRILEYYGYAISRD